MPVRMGQFELSFVWVCNKKSYILKHKWFSVLNVMDKPESSSRVVPMQFRNVVIAQSKTRMSMKHIATHLGATGNAG
ncbi:MAG: hypothetical protein EDM79_16905 [Chloroflexi bacterium]|nr:MAG: hypothetical protein EDM79_16905 [Chloroflexota bacterium]